MEPLKDLSKYAWLSIGTGVVVFKLKLGAYLLTGSVGLLSDALDPPSTSWRPSWR